MSSGGFMSSVVGRLFHGKEKEGRGHKRRSAEAQMQISSPLFSPLPPSLSHSASSLTSSMTSPMMSSSAPSPVSPMTQSSASPLFSSSMTSTASPLTSSPASSSSPSSSTPRSDVQGMKKWEHSRRKASMELLANAQQPPSEKSFSDTQSYHNTSICSDSTVENRLPAAAAASSSLPSLPVSSSLSPSSSSQLSPSSSPPSSPFASPVSPLSSQSPSSSSSMANLATSATTPVILRRDETNSGKSPLLSSLRKKARPFSCFVAVPESPPSSRRPLYSAEEGTPNKKKEDQKSQNEKNEPRKGENQETKRDVFIQKEKKNEKKGKEQTVQGHTQERKNDTKKQRKQREKELTKQKEKDKEMAKQREKEKQKRDKDAAKNKEKDAMKRRDKQKTKRPLSCIVQPPSPRPDLDRELIMLTRGRRESKDKKEKENQHGEWARDQPIGISEPRRRENLQQKHRPVSCFVLPPPPASPPPENPNQHQKQNQNHPWERESSAVSEPRRHHHENGRQPKPRPVSCFVLPPPPSPPPSPPFSSEKQNQPLRPRTPLQTPPPYPGRPKSYFSQEALERTPYVNQHSRKSPEMFNQQSMYIDHQPSTKTEMLDQRFSGARLPAHLSKSEEALDQRPSTPVQLSANAKRPQHQFLSQSMQALDQQPPRSRTPLQQKQTREPYSKAASRSSQFIDADFSVKQFYSANQSYTFGESDLPQRVSHQRSASSPYYSETDESGPTQRGKVSHQRSASSSIYYYEAGETESKQRQVFHQRSASSSPYYSEVGETDQLQQEKISHRRSASSPFYSEALLALSEPPKKEKKKNSQTPPNRQVQHNAGFKENQYSDFKQHGYSQDGYRDTSRQKSTPAMRSCRSYEQLDLPRSSGNYSPVSILSGRSDPICDFSKGRYSPASREFQLKLHQDQEYAANISSSNRHSYVHQETASNSSSNRHAYVVSDSDSPVNAKHQDKSITSSKGSYENTSIPANRGSPLSHYENTNIPASRGSPASPYENANFVSNHREKEGDQRHTPPTLHGAQTSSNSSHVYDTPTVYPSKTGGNSGGPLSYDLKSFFPSMTAEEKSYHLSMTSEEESSFSLTTQDEKSYSPSVKQDQRSLTPSMTPDPKRFTPPMVSDQKSHHHSHSTTSEQKSHYHSMTSGQRSYSPSVTSDKNSHAHYHSTTSDIRSYSPSMTSDHKSHPHSHHTSSDQRSYSPSMTSSDQKVHSHLTSATSSPRRPQRPQSACFLCQPPPCCSQGQRSARPVSQCFLPNCSLPGWCPGPGLGWDPSDDRIRSSSPYLASSNARSSSPCHSSPTPYSGSPSPSPAPQRSSTRSDSNSQPRVTFGPTYSIPVAASSHSSPAFTTHATNQVDSRTNSVAVCNSSQVSSGSSKISSDSSLISSHSRPISSYSTSVPAPHSSPTASHSIPVASNSIPPHSHSRSEPSSHSNPASNSSTAATRSSPTAARSSPHSSSCSSPVPSPTASILKRQQRIEDDDDEDGQGNTERSDSYFSRNDANRKSKAGYFSIHDEREKSNVELSGSYFSRNDALRKSKIEGSVSYFSSNDEPRKGNVEQSDRHCFSRKHRKNSSTQTEGEYVTSEDEEEEAFEEEEEDEEEEEEAEVEELEAAECDEDVEEKAQEEAEEGDKVKEPTNHPSEDSSHTTPDEKLSQEPDKPKETEQQSGFNDTIQSAKSQSSVETFDQSTRPVVSPTLSSSMATPHRQSPIPKPRTWVPKPDSVSSVQREEGETIDNGPLRTSSPALETSSPALETSSPALRTSSPAPRPAKRTVPPRPRPRSMCVFAEDDFPLGYASSTTTEFRSAFQCGYVSSNAELQRSKVESSNNSVASKPPRSPMKKYKSADCLDRLDESECSEKRPLPSRRQKIPSLTLTSPPSQSPLKKKSSTDCLDCLVGQTQDFLSVENSLTSTSTSTLTSNCDPARLLTSTSDPVRPVTPIYSYSDTTDTEQQPTGGEERKRRRRRDEIYSSTQLLNKLSEPSSGRRYTHRPRPASWFLGSGDESGYFGNASLGGGGRFASRPRGAGGLSASTNDLIDMMKHGEDCDDLLDVADDELSYDDKCGSLKKALSSGSLLKQSSIQDKSFNVMKRRRQKMKNRRQTQTSPNARSSSTETDEGVDLHHSYSASSLLDQSETATGESATFTGIPLDGRASRGSGDAIALDGSSSRGGGDAISLVGRGQGGVVKRLSSAHGNMKAWELRLRRKQIQMKRRSYEMMTEDQPRRETLV